MCARVSGQSCHSASIATPNGFWSGFFPCIVAEGGALLNKSCKTVTKYIPGYTTDLQLVIPVHCMCSLMTRPREKW